MFAAVASRLRKGAIAGALAPFVFLLSAVAISWLEKDFMGQLGWDEWPSGLALGSDGWLQIVNFIVFGLLLMGFAGAVAAVPARSRWARVAPVFLAIAGVAAVMLAFKEDPQSGDTTTWHGIIHVAAYFTWLLSLVVSYPFTWWRLRGVAFGRRHDGRAHWPSFSFRRCCCCRTAVPRGTTCSSQSS